MVICAAMDTMVVPRPPPLNLPPAEPFRLLPDPASHGDDSGSVYSLYKQKIDQMFEPGLESAGGGSSATNSVQARIERMFSDVVGTDHLQTIGTHHFCVDYLGSVPLPGKVTSLAGLQAPLRQLYFNHHRTTSSEGKLEISALGLRVHHMGGQHLNPFPSIAVWSAVKFVLQGAHFAFLPLITDPDCFDKQKLFAALLPAERRWLCAGDTHAPLFAVVMRMPGAGNRLECHAFVCRTSEDAIVIAATLYKSLMAYMDTMNGKPPKNRNGVTCMSAASSSTNGGPVRPPRKKRSPTMTSSKASSSEPPAEPPEPQRAPSTIDDLDAIVAYEDDQHDHDETVKEVKLPLGDKWNTFISSHQKQITAEIKQVMSESANMGLRHVQSPATSSSSNSNSSPQQPDNSGDILTKVTIPRSGSFLNAGGLTRYKSKVHRLNGQAMGGSPLGFHELFNEFRLQEGLHSLDDILGVIIDAEGMSFNDLKPIYKEFLLKLSVTLTKDELYQRSKSIMRRQRKKLLRRVPNEVPVQPPPPPPPAPPKRAPPVFVLGGRFKRLKHVFQRMRSGGTIRPKKTKKMGYEEAAVTMATSSISSASYDTRHFAPRTSEESECLFSVQRAATARNHNRHSSSGYVSCSECSFDSDTCTCVSADKCYCSLGQPATSTAPTAAPTISPPLTWCGCDTDSCADSNKCYCAMMPPSSGERQRPQHVCGTKTAPKTKRMRKKKRSKGRSKQVAYGRLEHPQTPDYGAGGGGGGVRMIANALYAPSSGNARMYSAQNGLYTIQSQSDRESTHGRRACRMQQQQRHRAPNLETSLGYLP